MGKIFIGSKIVPEKDTTTKLIRCCSCHKYYDFKGNIFSSVKERILVCPHCGLKHKVDFTPFDNRIDNLIKVDRLNLTTYTSQYPPAHSTTYVKATTDLGSSYYPHFATDPALPLTGTRVGNQWLSDTNEVTNQRFHVDLGSAKIIKRIYYENNHHAGGSTNSGANNFTFWGSNTEASFLQLTYGTDTGWTQITTATSVFVEHIDEDQADPYYITCTNSTAYRYYAFKFADNHGDTFYMGVRRIDLQTEDVVFEYAGTGSLTYSGSGSYYYEKSAWEYVGSGNFVFSGTGIYSIGFTYAGSGELTYSGDAITTIGFAYAGSGELIYSGAATVTIGFASIGSGTYNFSGVGLYSLGLFYVGIGEFIYSGSATQAHTLYYLYAGSGVFTYSGEAVLRWGDWSEVTKGTSDFTEVGKKRSNWSKIDKEKGDWRKTIKL